MIPDRAAIRAKCAVFAKPAVVLLLVLCTACPPFAHAQDVVEVDPPRVAMRQQAVEKARELSRALTTNLGDADELDSFTANLADLFAPAHE